PPHAGRWGSRRDACDEGRHPGRWPRHPLDRGDRDPPQADGRDRRPARDCRVQPSQALTVQAWTEAHFWSAPRAPTLWVTSLSPPWSHRQNCQLRTPGLAPGVRQSRRPILWHIMKIYAHHGFREFVVALGYKGDVIKRYFLDYAKLQCQDLTVNLGSGDVMRRGGQPEDWIVHLVDTGNATNTGGPIKRPAPIPG